MIFLSAAILEERKNLLGEWSPLSHSQRDAASVHAVSRGRQAPSPLLVALSDLALGWVGLYADIIRVSSVPQDLPFPSPSRPRLLLLQCSRFQSLNLRVIPLGTGQTKGEGLSPFELLGNGIRGLFHRFVGSWVTLSRDVTPHLASQFYLNHSALLGPTWCQWVLPLDPALDRESCPPLRVSGVKGWGSCYGCFKSFGSSTISEDNSLIPRHGSRFGRVN